MARKKSLLERIKDFGKNPVARAQPPPVKTQPLPAQDPTQSFTSSTKQATGKGPSFFGRGGGGSSGSSSQPSSVQARANISGISIAQQKQRDAVARRNAELQRERELAKKLREMNVRQRQLFFQQQRDIQRALNLQRQQEQGKKLTQNAKDLLDKVKNQQSNNSEVTLQERQVGVFTASDGTRVPQFEVIAYGDGVKGGVRKATPEEVKFFRNQSKVLQTGEVVFDNNTDKKVFDLNRRLSELTTKKQRDGKLTAKEELEIARLTAQLGVFGAVQGIKNLPSAVIDIIKNPSQLKNIPSVISDGGKKFGQILRISPTQALAKIGTEIFLLKGTGSAIKIVGRYSKLARTRLSFKFRGVKNQRITIPSGQKGKKNIVIELGGSVKKLAEPTSKQIKRAGKKLSVVTSAQADALLGLLKRSKVIRKPIPNEELLSKKTKALLKKFDDGKINKNQLLTLDKAIRKETKGAGSLLERSFFADPKGRLRPSRLGSEPKDASLLDILADDISFKASKPQVLVFEDVIVQKFPKTKVFDSIKRKLKTKNPVLTKAETNALIKFQQKPSGKFKPLGAISKEPELTISPSEIIKKKKVLAKTIINGKSVEIVSAKIVKTTKTTKKLLSKMEKGKATKKELKKLEKNLEKETGFKNSLTRRKGGGKVVRQRIAPRSRSRKRTTTRRTGARRVTTPRTSRGARTTRTPARTTRRTPIPKRTTRGGRLLRGGRTTKPPVKPPVTLRLRKKGKKVKKKKRVAKGFNVFAKPLKKKKLVKVNKVPLTKSRAESLRNYITDTSLSRTSSIKATRLKPQKPKLKVPSGYASRTKSKFRTYRIVKGRRKPLPKGKVIERSKRLLDTKQERKGITLRRRIAQLRKPIKKKKVLKVKIKPKKRITSAQRRVLLQRLQKARAVRLRKLRGGKRK